MPELVGQPFKVIAAWPQVLLQCMCPGPGIQIVVLTGFKNMVRCPRCTRGFWVDAANPDGTYNIMIFPPEKEQMVM